MGFDSRNGTGDLDVVGGEWCDPGGIGGFDADDLVFDFYAGCGWCQGEWCVSCVGRWCGRGCLFVGGGRRHDLV